ncbi:hypothetical protein [Actinomycetospora lemnae]|uniref:Abortive infection Abi-like protein n=1 Tax=Actinomycetospora lemnae TaxID=3019891 RepID=A0ABT5SSS1_9PSEU|nr:hypothetical protein [Actinomycetospora sp. DW7H6]MDD7965893.1 hypothetical protein [Actinomycetospora sp. DW7H6]
MRAQDFFTETNSGLQRADAWDTVETLDEQMLDRLRAGAVKGRDDVAVAQGLVELVSDELTGYGTDGSHRLENRQIEIVIKTMYAVLARLNIDTPRLPFRDFERFRTYWNKNGGYGSWQARRDMVHELLEPVRLTLDGLEELSFDELAEPASPRNVTGWPRVDEEIKELRRRFRSSVTIQDYRAVGTHCVGVLEALSRTAYSVDRHLRDGESEPPVSKSKTRLDRVIECAMPGEANEELRGLAKRAVAAAHLIKHKETPDRREAGIAADTTILLANIVRRLDSD